MSEARPAVNALQRIGAVTLPNEGRNNQAGYGVDAEDDAPRPPRRRWPNTARASIGFLISCINPAQNLIRLGVEPRRSCFGSCPGTRLASI